MRNTVDLIVPGENILRKRGIACCHSLISSCSKRSGLSRERVRSLYALLLYAVGIANDQPEPEFLAFAKLLVLFAFRPHLAIRTFCTSYDASMHFYCRTGQQPIAAPGGSEINHGIHRNTRKRESESTSPFRVLPGGGPTPAGWGAPPVGWGRSVVTRLYRTSWHDRCVCYDDET